MSVDRSYVLMAAPRTGSTLLCSILRETGIAGRPTEYYFPRAQANLALRWGITDPARYPERVLAAGTTPNGIFGLKMMFSYLDEVLHQAREVLGGAGADDVRVIERLAPRPQFVWVYRDDVIAQGVSWAKAAITNEWVVGDVRKWSDEARFDARLVHEYVWRATRLQIVARRWFAYHGVQPFFVSYEHLSADPGGVVGGLLDFLGLPRSAAPIRPRMQPQSDRRNTEWAEAYKMIARRLPAGWPSLTDPLPSERAWAPAAAVTAGRP